MPIVIYDIDTLYDYPILWLENNYFPGMYNEQYALEALLIGGQKFRVLFPTHLMCREHDDLLHKWFGTGADSSSSFWIIVE